MHRTWPCESVFNEQVLQRCRVTWRSAHAIQHNRCERPPKRAAIHCQSLVGEIAVAHNGNLINAAECARSWRKRRAFHSTSDSEVIARLIVRNINLGRRRRWRT